MEYEINVDTVALCPLTKNVTKIIELNNDFIVSKSVIDIMKDSCKFFGSTLAGRVQGTKSLIGVSHKAPIIVEESKEIIFFPTSSLKNVEKCYWICLKHIDKYYKIEDKIRIEFKKNITLNLNLSYGSLDNQILRATRLESVLRNRKNNI